MSQEFSAATVAHETEEQEEDGMEEEDLLQPVPQDLRLVQPLLEVVETRNRKAVAGMEVQGFTSCQDHLCAACLTQDCKQHQEAIGAGDVCLLCRDGLQVLCVLRVPCPSWSPEEINRFRSSKEAHLMARRTMVIPQTQDNQEPPKVDFNEYFPQINAGSSVATRRVPHPLKLAPKRPRRLCGNSSFCLKAPKP